MLPVGDVSVFIPNVLFFSLSQCHPLPDRLCTTASARCVHVVQAGVNVELVWDRVTSGMYYIKRDTSLTISSFEEMLQVE